MAIDIDDVLARLNAGTLDESSACSQLEQLAREAPHLAQIGLWRIELEMTAKRLPVTVGRALLQALKAPAAEKTVWLDAAVVAARADAGAAAASPRISQPPSNRPAAKTPSRASSFVSGTVVKGRYRLLDPVGQARTPLTFNAVDLQAASNASASVTVKLIVANFDTHPEAFERLETAVHQTQRLIHPHIAVPRAVDRDADVAILIYEPLHGRWLSAVLREVRDHGMERESALPLLRSLADALACAHDLGIAHGEFNPRNILINDHGAPRILNFAIAPALAQAVDANDDPDALDTVTMRAYTEAYIVDGVDADAPRPADDVYPLGLVAHELLTGKHPFRRQSMRVAREQAMTAASIGSLSARQNAAIARCLSFDTAKRPEHAGMFLHRWDGPTMLQKVLVAFAMLIAIAAVLAVFVLR